MSEKFKNANVITMSGDQSTSEVLPSTLAAGESNKRPKPGILRLDISKPKRSSGGSVEFRNQPELLGEGPSGTQTQTGSPAGQDGVQTPQLSVTWASQCVLNDPDRISNSPAENTSPQPYDKIKRFPVELKSNNGMDPSSPLEIPECNSEDEDYSLSVSAIIQRRASVRGNRKKGYRSPRRTSSPMDHVFMMGGLGGPGGMGGMIGGGIGGTMTGERRRSSVYTTSSGDTAISLDDGTNQDSTQEQIYENIRLHKEVLQSVKLQPWSIRRKLRLVRQAKAYVVRHEGVLQERFAMSRSTKDLWARFKIVMAAKWLHFKREMVNYSTVLIPWELRIKEIESHFGSVVASFFTFLRWLFWMNIIIAVILSAFIIIPEVISNTFLMPKNSSSIDDYKVMLPGELEIAGNLVTLWDFEGYLKYSPLFYGYYSDIHGASTWGYNLPLAYFLTGLTVYIYSFVATLRKMAENSRTSKLSSKDDECVFSWKLFTGWDYMIGHGETAHNRISSVVLGFKEALLEEAEKKKDTRNWRIIFLRILANLVFTCLLVSSAYGVVFVVSRSDEMEKSPSWLDRNEVSVVVNLITYTFPMMFEFLGYMESFHPRQQLRLQLFRIMLLNLLNLYSLIFATFGRIQDMNMKLEEKQSQLQNITTQIAYYESELGNLNRFTTTTTMKTTFNVNDTNDFFNNPTELLDETQTYCFDTKVKCTKPTISLTTSLLLLNITTTMFPDMWNNFSSTSLISSDYPHLMDATTGTWENVSYNQEDEFENYGTTTSDYDDFSENQPKKRIRRTNGNNFTTEVSVFKQLADALNIALKSIKTTTKFTKPKKKILRTTREIPKKAKTTTIPDFTTIIPSTDEQYESSESSISSETENFFVSTNSNDIYEMVETTITDYIANSSTTQNITMENIRDYKEIIKTTIDDMFTNFTTPVATSSESSATTLIEEDAENCTETVCVPVTESTTSIPLSTIKIQTTTTDSSQTDTNKINATYPDERNNKEYYENTLNNLTQTQADSKRDLKGLCWETMFGQSLAKIIVMDSIMTILTIFLVDFVRGLFVRYMNNCWCWDMEKRFPEYGDFKIAENILQLVCNQGQVWMGMFFSPGLAILNLFKLVMIMYIRSWAVKTCNVPHEVVFRASRSNNFYLTLLLCMLFLCVLPVGYAIVWLRPSWHCGPYKKKDRIYKVFTETLRNALHEDLRAPLDYIASASTVIPLLLLLILIIYYLISLTGALREANNDLKNQLRKERTEERRKMIKVLSEKPTENAPTSITARWKKVLESSSPLSPRVPNGPNGPLDIDDQIKAQARKELLSRIMKKALRKGSATSDDESIMAHAHDDDETDNEQHDSLPHDGGGLDNIKRRSLPARGRGRRPSIIDVVTMMTKENAANAEQHPNTRFKVEKIENTDDNDPEANSRIVSERRRSLLRRQQNIHEPTGSTIHEKDDNNTNYEIINEKNKEVEKKSKLKFHSNVEPEVFKFDENTLESTKRDESSSKPDDSDRATEILRKLLQKKISIKRGVPSPETSSRKTLEIKATEIDKSASTSPTEKSPALLKGRRKLGSFLALVKEAVNIKKLENENEDDEKTSTDPGMQATSSRAEIVVEPIVKEEVKNSSSSPADGEQSKFRKDRSPKRQDSQNSVWSENIPVITISKTESDEFLESTDKDKERQTKKATKTKPKGHVKDDKN